MDVGKVQQVSVNVANILALTITTIPVAAVLPIMVVIFTLVFPEKVEIQIKFATPQPIDGETQETILNVWAYILIGSTSIEQLHIAVQILRLAK